MKDISFIILMFCVLAKDTVQDTIEQSDALSKSG